MPVTPELLRSLYSLPISGSTKVATASATGGEGGKVEGRRHAAAREGRKMGVEERVGRRGDDHPEWRGRRERGTNEHIKGFHQKSSRMRNSK